MNIYRGKGACPGIAIGKVRLLQKFEVEINKIATGSATQEYERFLTSKAETYNQLEVIFEKTKLELDEESAMIIDVQRMMLNDGDFNGVVENLIKEERCTAEYAVTQAGNQISSAFASLEDPYMSARAADMTDLAQRLVNTLCGRVDNLQLDYPAIVVADDLTPSETLQMEKSKILAFVTVKGSQNSHTAILARAMGIPCIIQVDISLDFSIDGREIIVNANDGMIYLDPDQGTSSKMLKEQEEGLAHNKLLGSMKGLPTVTKDGRKIRLYSNIGSASDLPSVLENDSEGIGLFRSEFLYLGRNNYPTEDEQFKAYRTVAEGMGGKTVIIRTLDIGADKNAVYFGLEKEENPALGLRGIRICIDRPDIFRTQLRAIYRASAFGNIAIMFPMITSLWEVQRCKEITALVRKELSDECITFGNIQIGIMIETPASVMEADTLAKEVDFFSVGTNDLTQYTLSIDRHNDKLDQFYDPQHPAVMKMLAIVVRAAHENGIWAGICGELASNPAATQALVDMGFDELSVSPIYTLKLRKIIREIGEPVLHKD